MRQRGFREETSAARVRVRLYAWLINLVIVKRDPEIDQALLTCLTSFGYVFSTSDDSRRSTTAATVVFSIAK